MEIRTNRNRKFIRSTTMAVMAMMVSLSIAGCSKEEAEVAKKEVAVEAQKPQVGTLILQNDFIGSITPQEEVYVVPFVSAEVLESNVAVGDYVSEGTVLCKLDDSAADLQLDSAKAGLETAKAGKASARGGAVEAQNLQTESGIQELKNNIANVRDGRASIVDGIAEVEKQMKDLKEGKNTAKDAYAQTKEIVNAAKAYEADQTDAAAIATLEDAGFTINDQIPPAMVVSAAKEANSKAKAAYESVKATYDKAYPELEKTKAELEASKKELDQTETTLNNNLNLAEQTYELSKGQIAKEAEAVYNAQINSAAVGVESAAYQKDMYILKAPISGVVEAVNVEKNSFASSGNPAYIISNKESMTVTFRVSEAIRNTLTTGEKLTVDRNGTQFSGTISEVGQMVDQQSGLFVIKASVNAGGSELLTGTSVKVTANTHEAKNSILIPYDSIYYDNGQAYVYVAKDGLAIRADIEVLLFNDTTAAVSEGITADDMVITTWSPLLADNVEISVKESKEAEDESN